VSRRRWTAAVLVVVAVAAGAWWVLRPPAQRVTLVALDRRTGGELWRTHLDGYELAGGPVHEVAGVARIPIFRTPDACVGYPYLLSVNAATGHVVSIRPQRPLDSESWVGPPRDPSVGYYGQTFTATSDGIRVIAKGRRVRVYDGQQHLVFTTRFEQPRLSALLLGRHAVYLGVDTHHGICDN
jgi:outer membrane protein assembly factor BamB